MSTRDVADNISPLDYRYWDHDIAGYLSDATFLRYKLTVELALVRALHKHGVAPADVVQELEAAVPGVSFDEVRVEESRVGHDIRAMVNVLRRRVSDKAKPFVHMTATSYDIIDTANALRFRDTVRQLLIPSLKDAERVLLELALREAETVQIGRTHGQHAVPITFGYAIAGYVSRLGGCIEALDALARELKGKFSGAVGAYNASNLFFVDPEAFERDVLAEVDLAPHEHSTQVAPHEPVVRLLTEVGIAVGVLADLADDMRHLERSEIGEVSEAFGEHQVGSSTMPQKRNPISFEQVKSLWKIIIPRLQTVLMDQLSEHQRDLTNSASSRTYGEIIAYATVAARRVAESMRTLTVNKGRLERNLLMSRGAIAAEPLYITLASMGHPNAHEKVRQLTREAERAHMMLADVAEGNTELTPYFERMTYNQRRIIKNPALYAGVAAKKASAIATRWRQKLGL